MTGRGFGECWLGAPCLGAIFSGLISVFYGRSCEGGWKCLGELIRVRAVPVVLRDIGAGLCEFLQEFVSSFRSECLCR